MQQRMRDVRILLKHNTKALMMRVCLLALGPVFCNLVLASGAQALSLPGVLREVTAPVTYLLPRTPVAPEYTVPSQTAPVAEPVAPAPTPQSSPANSPGAVPITPIANSTAQPTSSGVAGGALGQLPPIDQNLLTGNSRHKVRLVGAQKVPATPVSQFALLEPSAQGWRIAGVAWYWWVVAGVLLGLLVRAVRGRVLSRTRQKPLVS